MADNFQKLEPWIAGFAKRVGPAGLRKVARKIGMALRRDNARRIAANQEPNGSAMEARKPRPKRELPDWLKQRIRANPALRAKFGKRRSVRHGKMFPKIRLARNLRVHAKTKGVEVNFDSRVSRGANTHHFGLRDRVSRFRGAPMVKYPARALLGFADEDDGMILRAVIEQIEDGR